MGEMNIIQGRGKKGRPFLPYENLPYENFPYEKFPIKNFLIKISKIKKISETGIFYNKKFKKTELIILTIRVKFGII